MAKSFHNIISEGTLEVNHQGEDVVLDLPEWLKESKGILMDSELLVAWANEHEIIHGLLHAGIQKTIIDMRAKARPNVDIKSGKSDSIVSDKDGAQDRIDDFVVKPTLPPGSSTPKAFSKGEESALKMSIEAMQEIGMDNEAIVTALSTKFDIAKIRHIIELIKGENQAG